MFIGRKIREIKNAVSTLLTLAGFLTICFLIIHRRVIAAKIQGKPLPEAPEWHKKLFCRKKA